MKQARVRRRILIIPCIAHAIMACVHALTIAALLYLAATAAQAQNCTFLPELAPCDDGNLTNVGDRCVLGECVGCEPNGEPCTGR